MASPDEERVSTSSTSAGICALPLGLPGEEPDTDEPSDVSSWQIVDIIANIGLILLGIITLCLQIAWLSRGDTRVAVLLWTGPAISISGVAALVRIFASKSNYLKTAAIFSVVCILAVICSLVFGIVIGTTEKLKTGIFILGGSAVMINYMTVPACIVSGVFSWSELVKSIKVTKNSVGPPIRTISSSVTANTPSNILAPPPPSSLSTAVCTANTSTSDDGYETPVAKIQTRTFRRPKPSTPIVTPPLRPRSLPAPPDNRQQGNLANDGEDDSDPEHFVLNEGYMTPSSELRLMANSKIKSLNAFADGYYIEIPNDTNTPIDRTDTSPSPPPPPPPTPASASAAYESVYNYIPSPHILSNLKKTLAIHKREAIDGGIVMTPKSLQRTNHVDGAEMVLETEDAAGDERVKNEEGISNISRNSATGVKKSIHHHPRQEKQGNNQEERLVRRHGGSDKHIAPFEASRERERKGGWDRDGEEHIEVIGIGESEEEEGKEKEKGGTEVEIIREFGVRMVVSRGGDQGNNTRKSSFDIDIDEAHTRDSTEDLPRNPGKGNASDSRGKNVSLPTQSSKEGNQDIKRSPSCSSTSTISSPNLMKENSIYVCVTDDGEDMDSENYLSPASHSDISNIGTGGCTGEALTADDMDKLVIAMSTGPSAVKPKKGTSTQAIAHTGLDIEQTLVKVIASSKSTRIRGIEFPANQYKRPATSKNSQDFKNVINVRSVERHGDEEGDEEGYLKPQANPADSRTGGKSPSSELDPFHKVASPHSLTPSRGSQAKSGIRKESLDRDRRRIRRTSSGNGRGTKRENRALLRRSNSSALNGEPYTILTLDYEDVHDYEKLKKAWASTSES